MKKKKIGTNMYCANILVFLTDVVFHNNRTEDRFQDKTHKFHDKSKLGSSDKIISKELTHTLIQDDI